MTDDFALHTSPEVGAILICDGDPDGQTVNYDIFNNILLVREDVQLVRISANFHVIPVRVVGIWSKLCTGA